MSKKHQRHESTLHPLDAFGIKRVSLSSIRVERLEERINPKVPFPHKHDFYQIILLTAGSGMHQIDFAPHEVEKKQLFVMKPTQVHSWNMKNPKGFVIEFNRDSLEGMGSLSPELIKQLDYLPDVFPLNTDDFTYLRNLSHLMHQEFMGEKENLDLALRGHLIAFLVPVLRMGPIGNKGPATIILDRLRNLIEKNYKQHHRVEFYAKELKITPKALTMQLSRLIGKAPRLLIQERCLLEAKRFLAYSSLSVAEIGHELGFEDANYFTRFFRIHEKMTPATFRRNFRP